MEFKETRWGLEFKETSWGLEFKDTRWWGFEIIRVCVGEASMRRPLFLMRLYSIPLFMRIFDGFIYTVGNRILCLLGIYLILCSMPVGSSLARQS